MKEISWFLDAFVLAGAFVLSHIFWISKEPIFLFYAVCVLLVQLLGFAILKLDFYDVKRFLIWSLHAAVCVTMLNLAFECIPVYVPALNSAIALGGFISIRVFLRVCYRHTS